MKNQSSNLSIIGRKFEANFGEKAFTLFYENPNKLVLTEIKGPEVGRVQILTVSIVELRSNLFMVNRQEESKLTVTDIEDYEKGVVYANMTTPNDNFISAKGTLKEIKTSFSKE